MIHLKTMQGGEMLVGFQTNVFITQNYHKISCELLQPQMVEQRVLQGISSCDSGGRVQVQHLIQQLIGLIRDCVPAQLVFLYLTV